MSSKKLMQAEIKIQVSPVQQSQKNPVHDYSESPQDKTISESNNLIVVENKWKQGKKYHSKTKIKKIVYFKEEDLADFDTIYSSNPKEVLRLSYNGKRYILRKSSLDVAKALVKIYSKIKDHVEYFVGYLITSLSTVYLITRSENSFFSSNPSLSSEVSRFKDIKDLEPEDKISVLEKMIEKIIELNKKNLFILDIDLNNLIFSDKQVLLSDLRKLRMSTHPKALIDSLKSLIINLLERKIIKIEEAEYLLSYYMGGNPEVCSSWYKLKNKKDADEIDVLYALEQEIIEPRFA